MGARFACGADRTERSRELVDASFLVVGLTGLGLVGGGLVAFTLGNVLGLCAYTGVILGAVGLIVFTLHLHEEHEPAKADSDIWITAWNTRKTKTSRFAISSVTWST